MPFATGSRWCSSSPARWSRRSAASPPAPCSSAPRPRCCCSTSCSASASRATRNATERTRRAATSTSTVAGRASDPIGRVLRSRWVTHPTKEGSTMTERTGATAPDGALRDLAEDPSSRKRFLRMMGGAGAASALAIFMAACGGDDDDNSSAGGTATTSTNSGAAMADDLEIVQYALTLEHLETDFYNAVIDAGVIKD